MILNISKGREQKGKKFLRTKKNLKNNLLEVTQKKIVLDKFGGIFRSALNPNSQERIKAFFPGAQRKFHKFHIPDSFRLSPLWCIAATERWAACNKKESGEQNSYLTMREFCALSRAHYPTCPLCFSVCCVRELTPLLCVRNEEEGNFWELENFIAKLNEVWKVFGILERRVSVAPKMPHGLKRWGPGDTGANIQRRSHI